MKNKKYYSIAEVCEITGIPAHKLRYLEKCIPEIQIFKVRGRRYYTQVDIHNIKMKCSTQIEVQGVNILVTSNNNNEILFKIDELLNKFTAFTKD